MPRISDQTAARLLKGLTTAQLRVLDILPANGDRLSCEAINVNPRTLRALSAPGTPLLKCRWVDGTAVEAGLNALGMKLKAVRLEQLQTARGPSTRSRGAVASAATRNRNRAKKV